MKPSQLFHPSVAVAAELMGGPEKAYPAQSFRSKEVLASLSVLGLRTTMDMDGFAVCVDRVESKDVTTSQRLWTYLCKMYDGHQPIRYASQLINMS